MNRRWRVRHSYPQPVVDLVRLLLPLHTVREIAGLLDIPMSVIYRWRALERGDGAESERRCAEVESLSAAATRCDEVGFRFVERLAAANRSAWPPPRVVQPVAASTPVFTRMLDAVAKARPDADNRILAGLSDRHAARNILELPSWSCVTRRRYVFDVRKERSTRRVRQRLEAARRMIDVEYFLEIDCRTLADTARMSPHHFIRMFSQVFGSTPHQYLIRTRVEAAKRLLLASREPIEVIATGVGFRSGQSLNRAFKQIEGVSVSRFCNYAGKNAAVPRPARPVRTVDQDHPYNKASDATTSVAAGA